MLITKEQAEAFVQKLADVLEDNEQTGGVLIQHSYTGAIERAKSSLERRIRNGQFKPFEEMRVRFSQDRIYD